MQGRIGTVVGFARAQIMPFGAASPGAFQLAIETFINEQRFAADHQIQATITTRLCLSTELQHYGIQFGVLNWSASKSALLCQEAILERTEFAWASLSDDLRRTLGEEYKLKSKSFHTPFLTEF